jgi:hypothetical protein
MLNAVGREIPEEILERTGKEVFQGNNYKDGKAFQKASPKVTPVMRNDHDKMVKDIHEALVKCNAHDGMTVSFHHHFREGDLVVCMVMEEIHKMGFKNITLSASSLGKAHDALVPMIEDGTIVKKGDQYSVDLGGDLIPLPKEKTADSKLDSYVGKKVKMGIRPEDIDDEPEFMAKHTDCQLDAKVDVSEMMGAEIYLYLEYKGNKMTARVAPTSKARNGDTVRVAFDPHKVHLFDIETEQTILN